MEEKIDARLVRRPYFLREIVFFWALWQLFVGKLNASEMRVGLAAAILCAAAMEPLRSERFAPFSPRLFWLFQLWRIPGYIVSGTAVIFADLFARVFLKKKSEAFFERSDSMPEATTIQLRPPGGCWRFLSPPRRRILL